MILHTPAERALLVVILAGLYLAGAMALGKYLRWRRRP